MQLEIPYYSPLLPTYPPMNPSPLRDPASVRIPPAPTRFISGMDLNRSVARISGVKAAIKGLGFRVSALGS